MPREFVPPSPLFPVNPCNQLWLVFGPYTSYIRPQHLASLPLKRPHQTYWVFVARYPSGLAHGALASPWRNLWILSPPKSVHAAPPQGHLCNAAQWQPSHRHDVSLNA